MKFYLTALVYFVSDSYEGLIFVIGILHVVNVTDLIPVSVCSIFTICTKRSQICIYSAFAHHLCKKFEVWGVLSWGSVKEPHFSHGWLLCWATEPSWKEKESCFPSALTASHRLLFCPHWKPGVFCHKVRCWGITKWIFFMTHLQISFLLVSLLILSEL